MLVELFTESIWGMSLACLSLVDDRRKRLRRSHIHCTNLVRERARPGSGDEILLEGCARCQRSSLTHYSARTEPIVEVKTVLYSEKHMLSRGVLQIVWSWLLKNTLWSLHTRASFVFPNLRTFDVYCERSREPVARRREHRLTGQRLKTRSP